MAGPVSDPTRHRLSHNVAASMLTAGALIATSLISVPIIVATLGTEGFGIWSLAVAVVVFVSTAEAGIGPAVQRFVAVGRAEDTGGVIARLAWTSLALYVLLGVAVLGALQVAADPLVDAFDVPEGLVGDAHTMFRLIGVAVLLALLVTALGNVMQGLERFFAYAVTTAIAAILFLVAVAVLLGRDGGLVGLAWAAILQKAAMLAGRVWALRDVLFSARPGLIASAQAREIAGFSLRLQASVLSLLVNTQTDKVIVGLVAPARTLGLVAIGSQVAEAGRLVLGAALTPMISRLSAASGLGHTGARDALFTRLDRLWVLVVVGGTVIGAATLTPLLAGWLGEGYSDAALYGAVLVTAYGIGLIPSVMLAYLRAVGRPGLEARYGLTIIGLNVALTVGLGLVAGAVGVVVATAIAYLLGTAWLLARARGATPGPSPLGALGPRVLMLAIGAGAAAFGWGVAVVAVVPAGVALVPVGLGAAAALALYLAAATGVRPTAAGLRTLSGGR